MNIFNHSSGKGGSPTWKEVAILVFLPFLILYWLIRIVVWVVRRTD
jgi:hypothetical protein